MGDVRMGFVVDRRVLVGVGEQVRAVFGLEMVLLERLRAKLEGGTGEFQLIFVSFLSSFLLSSPLEVEHLFGYTLLNGSADQK
jgi:hypothetical protein